MYFAYSRVSTDDQKLSFQEDVLKEAGCEGIFCEKVSGAHVEQPGLQEALDFLHLIPQYSYPKGLTADNLYP